MSDCRLLWVYRKILVGDECCFGGQLLRAKDTMQFSIRILVVAGPSPDAN
jgi:hypothetical protein